MSKIVLSVIIPVYNEAAVIETVIREHHQKLQNLSAHFQEWEILCLNDASTDHCGKILQRLSQELPNVRVITHAKNKGIQSSFMELHLVARGTHIYHTAGDNQWPTENLERLLNALLKDQLDYVIGVRENRHKVYTPWRKILSYGYNLLPVVTFGTKTKDANGIKLGRKEVFELPLISKSFFAETERIIEAKRKGYKIGFATVDFLPRSQGKAQGAKWKYIFGTLKDFIRYSLFRITRKNPS